MSTLRIEYLTIPAVNKGPDDSVPPIYRTHNPQQPISKLKGDSDELFLGYGFETCGFPYTYQNNYSRELSDRSFQSVILENEFLKAVFLPELGGRLWSLYDKIARRELLFVNPVCRLGNLATRNAWFSGGVEFNCGIIGHHPHTADQIYSAVGTATDGTPFFRMYEFERIRAMTYQIDCFLPEKSRFLHVRCRIMNETPHVVPAYWWSNIAVPTYKGGRIIVDAQDAFSQPGGYVYKTNLPLRNGIDITYPDNTIDSFDYFWNIPQNARKFITHVDADGYGLLQCSTKRLKGRKLFVWGQSTGSRRWQGFLSDGTQNGNYHEIQAGLAKTQYECVPMPPFTTWEWIETYGALSIDKQSAHGDWMESKAAARRCVNTILPEEELESLLEITYDTIAIQKADQMITFGSGWGALENERRRFAGQPPMAEHLEFGELHPQQKYWLNFLKDGCFNGTEHISSYMRQPEWTTLLEKSAGAAGEWNWQVHAHLGFIALCEDRVKEAETYLRTSLSLHQSSEALFGLSVLAELSKDNVKAADFAVQAAALFTENDHYAKHAAKLLYQAKKYVHLLSYFDEYPSLWQNGRCKLYAASAFVHTGQIEKANALLYENSGLEVPDLREGETAITELWFSLEEAKAQKGISDDRVPPEFFDFRVYEDTKRTQTVLNL